MARRMKKLEVLKRSLDNSSQESIDRNSSLFRTQIIFSFHAPTPRSCPFDSAHDLTSHFYPPPVRPRPLIHLADTPSTNFSNSAFDLAVVNNRGKKKDKVLEKGIIRKWGEVFTTMVDKPSNQREGESEREGEHTKAKEREGEKTR